MKLTARSLFHLLLLLTIVSCNNGTDEPVKKEPVPAPDSNAANTISVTHDVAVNPFEPVDVSPMDMSYYPVDYPKLKMANIELAPPVMRVVYSRPHLQGRHLFNEVLKYGEPWRLGANEATEIEFFRDVTIQGKRIKAGRYILYCIPEHDVWTIVLNSNIDSWGLKLEAAKDIDRFTIPNKHDHGGPSLESFTMVFEKSATGADLVMAWGDIIARLPIAFK